MRPAQVGAILTHKHLSIFTKQTFFNFPQPEMYQYIKFNDTTVILWSFLNLFCIVLIVLFFRYHWARRRLYSLSWKCNGPLAFPVIGNAYLLTGSRSSGKFLFFSHSFLIITNFLATLTQYIYEQVKFYSEPTRFWLRSYLFVAISKPQDLEIVLNSPKCLKKSVVYDKMVEVLGLGLLTAPGKKLYIN